MHSTAAAPAKKTMIRYGDHGALAWLWSEAPCSWREKTEIEFITVPIRQLEPAGSWTHPAIVNKWLTRMTAGRSVPPPVVCATERGTMYLRDGNHRYEAMRDLFAGDMDAPVRVARVVPKRGYEFRYRWFGSYGTYTLEPVAATETDRNIGRRQAKPGPALGRTLVLVAHPDDETGGCGGLLQRLCDPVVVFSTDGAPQDPYFWRRHGSPQNYGWCAVWKRPRPWLLPAYVGSSS
ncbi:MAG: hypothetical protein ACE14L_00785 [Terriglobales bacterium]